MISEVDEYLDLGGCLSNIRHMYNKKTNCKPPLLGYQITNLVSLAELTSRVWSPSVKTDNKWKHERKYKNLNPNI